MKELNLELVAEKLQELLLKNIKHAWLQWIIVTKLENGFDVKFTLITSDQGKIYSQVNLYLEFDLLLNFKRSFLQSSIHVVKYAYHDSFVIQMKINEEIMKIFQQGIIQIDKFHKIYQIILK